MDQSDCTHFIVNFTADVNGHVVVGGAIVDNAAMFGRLQIKRHNNGLAVRGSPVGCAIFLLRVCVQHRLEASSGRRHGCFQSAGTNLNDCFMFCLIIFLCGRGLRSLLAVTVNDISLSNKSSLSRDYLGWLPENPHC